MQGFNHSMPERPFMYVILTAAVRSYSNKTMIDLSKYHRLFYFFEILNNARKYDYIKLFNGSDNEFLNFVFENFHVFFNLFDFFLFFQDLSNARKYRTVCSPDPKRKFKFRLYEFLRIYQQITFFF